MVCASEPDSFSVWFPHNAKAWSSGLLDCLIILPVIQTLSLLCSFSLWPLPTEVPYSSVRRSLGYLRSFRYSTGVDCLPSFQHARSFYPTHGPGRHAFPCLATSPPSDQSLPGSVSLRRSKEPASPICPFLLMFFSYSFLSRECCDSRSY